MGEKIRYCGPVWFDFTLQPRTIAESYRLRWQVELLFNWIMKHLRIEAFYCTSADAVRAKILKVHPFEKAPLRQVLSHGEHTSKQPQYHNQWPLFDIIAG